MGKPAGSIQIKRDNPRFAEVCKALAVDPGTKESVYVSPDKAIYASLVGKNLTRDEKVAAIRIALACKTDAHDAMVARERMRARFEEASANSANAQALYRSAMHGFENVVPSGHSFRFGGVLYTHIHGELVKVDDSADDFDVETDAPKDGQAKPLGEQLHEEAASAPAPAPEAAPAPAPAPEAAPAPAPAPEAAPAPAPAPEAAPAPKGAQKKK